MEVGGCEIAFWSLLHYILENRWGGRQYFLKMITSTFNWFTVIWQKLKTSKALLTKTNSDFYVRLKFFGRSFWIRYQDWLATYVICAKVKSLAKKSSNERQLSTELYKIKFHFETNKFWNCWPIRNLWNSCKIYFETSIITLSLCLLFFY